jgi:hypothetical protein
MSRRSGLFFQALLAWLYVATDSEAQPQRVSEDDVAEGRLSIGVAFRWASRDGSVTVSVKDVQATIKTLPRDLQNREVPCPRNRHLERIRWPKHIVIAAACWACLWSPVHMLTWDSPSDPPRAAGAVLGA